jgi:acetylornithine deacetylase/succinyl-diaminopimelate desuccinylase-like protein
VSRAVGTTSVAQLRRVAFTPAERNLLLRLLDAPTAGPLETGGAGPEPQLWQAGRAYAHAAAGIGMGVVLHAAPAAATVAERDDVPVTVRDAARSPGFLACQPNLLLRLGPELPRSATVMCNVHLDTVAGWWPACFDGRRFHGRGAIDAKGPAVALLAGIRAARRLEPALGERVAVLVQAVAGEEGGAMGTFGTRTLVADGHIGRLNVFCEPTGLRALSRSTASMTACIQVRGQDAVDDFPESGHNATALLGHLAQHLAQSVPPQLDDGSRMCLAGLHTGDRHNRVYGSGQLLLNFSYSSPAAGRRIEAVLERAVCDAVSAFTARFATVPDFARTAADAASILRVRWLKRGLPALEPVPSPAGNSEQALVSQARWADELLDRAGIARWPDDAPAFTCDAIWMAGVPDTFTAVYGPGRLDANRAHADGEFAELAELEAFAAGIARLLVCYARDAAAAGRRPRNPPRHDHDHPDEHDHPDDYEYQRTRDTA